MSFRRFQILALLLAVFAAAGCDRLPKGEPVAEINEPDYVEGQRLLRQGNEQAALAAFTRVINARPQDAAESHLQLGLLYLEEVKDPITAIYHFRRYLELKPNSTNRDLVEQRIEVATRDFARTLPAQPLENQIMRNDLLDVVENLRVENTRLKDEVARLRESSSAGSPSALRQTANLSAAPTQTASLAPPENTANRGSRFSAAPLETLEERPVTTPTRPSETPAAATAQRVHTVAKGDTLYSLARRYYNNPSRAKDIYTANRNQMRSANDLQIGMRLVIPE